MNDPYFDTSVCVDRLIAEYSKHPRLIIAVDFDGTVFSESHLDNSYGGVFSLLRECARYNFYIVLFTAASPDRYKSMKKHMWDNGVQVDSINQNPIPLKYGNNGKIYYNLLLDDRSGLGQACSILDQFFKIVDKKPHLV